MTTTMTHARTNDMDLRIVVTSALLAGGIPREAIRHEIGMGGVRADMVVALDHALIGIEIKSGRDTLDRLERQAEAYRAAFDRPCLVMDALHQKVERSVFAFGHPPAAIMEDGALRTLGKFFPFPWADQVYSRGPRDLRPHAMLCMLWVCELQEILSKLLVSGAVPKGRRLNAGRRIIDHLAEHASIATLRPHIANALRLRPLNAWEMAFWARYDADQQEMAA